MMMPGPCFPLLAAAPAAPGAAAAAGGDPASTIVNSPLAPGLLFLLCAAGAAGMIMLLPGRKEGPIRKIGGAVLLASLLILAVVIGKTAAGMGIYFWLFAAIAVFGALRVVTHAKPVYSALYFVLTVMASAGLFVLMWAEFMAAALVLIYGGAILVTYVFVIMLAAEAAPEGQSGAAVHEQLAEHDAVSREPILASAVGFALLGVLLFVIFDKAQPLARNDARATASARAADAPVLAVASVPSTLPTGQRAPDGTFVPVGGTQKLGHYLFTRQLINLELAGLILTVAMVGAIVIARKRVVNPQQPIDISAQSGGGGGGGDPPAAEATSVRDDPGSIPVYGTENPRQKEYPET